MNTNEKPITLETITGNICGTMTLPGSGDNENIAIIISGSGPTDRDGNSRLVSGKHDCLKMLAAALAEQGVASVRYDKRGESYSYSAAPNEIDLSIERYVQDVVSWVSLLSNEYGYSDITIIGHSEGALIGMLAAQQCPVTRFISIAGSSEKGSNALRRQLNGKLSNELAKTSEHIISSFELGQTVDDVPQELNMLFRHSVQPYMISWFRYAPTDELSKLTIPCLILQGDTDIHITVNDSIALHHANKQSELKILSGMNHILKSVPPDFEQQIASYSDPDLPIVSEVISVISSFLSHSKTDLTKS